MVSRAPAHPRRACDLARGIALALVAGAVVAVSLGATLPSGASSPSPPAPTVRLLRQSPYVRSPGGVLSLSLTRSGPLALRDATVQLTLFTRLTTRFGLDDALSAPGPQGPIGSTAPLPVGCLAVARTVRVSVGVAPDGQQLATPRQCGEPAPTLRLGCSAGCDGVYPLRVTARGGGTVSSFVSLVTFAAASSQPLRVVWLFRMAGRAHGLLGATGALRALDAHPRVAATVDVQGVAIAHGLTEPGAASAVAVLRAAVSARVHELVGEPYVPADLGALLASRLFSEVRRQFELTLELLMAAGVPRSASNSTTVGTGPQTPTSVEADRYQRFRHLVIAGSSLAADPTDELTWGDAFYVSGVPGVTVLASDTALSSFSDQTAANPGLDAAQFLGELSFLHFEQPNLAQPRAVVVVTHATTSVKGSFVSEVLAGLTSNPVLTPVTVAGAFASVPVGANGFPSVRAMANGPSHRFGHATVAEIEFLRATTESLKSAVISGPTPIPSIEGMLLSAERVMPTARRWALFRRVHVALEDQLGYFRIYSGPITLTSSGATTIPITVLSSAPYGVKGVLRLASPRIYFPSHTIPFRLTSSAHSIRVPARALVNGDLPLSVQFVCPKRPDVLARALITVRVTGFSGVGIALTALALVVLAAWWVRTLRRRRTAS